MLRALPRLSFALTLTLAASPGAAVAQCYADYRARMDDPLRLHYGVVELADACTEAAAAAETAARLEAAGWTLLELVSVFEAAELEEKRADAGAFFLRF